MGGKQNNICFSMLIYENGFMFDHNSFIFTTAFHVIIFFCLFFFLCFVNYVKLHMTDFYIPIREFWCLYYFSMKSGSKT